MKTYDIFTVIYLFYIMAFAHARDCNMNNVLDNINTVGKEDTYFILEDSYLFDEKDSQTNKVKIQVYYESFCPGCREFDSTDFANVVEKLSEYLDIHTYPYGNAQTTENNGHYEFTCQHGPEECYGNKLHACSLDIIGDTKALLFNCCLMKYSHSGRGSDDAAADEWGTSMNIDSEPIKTCAKSDKGSELLKYYGDESKKVNLPYVPYILVNGQQTDADDFMKKVCNAFQTPPPPCSQ